jgi:hypothetical protein
MLSNYWQMDTLIHKIFIDRQTNNSSANGIALIDNLGRRESPLLADYRLPRKYSVTGCYTSHSNRSPELMLEGGW